MADVPTTSSQSRRESEPYRETSDQRRSRPDGGGRPRGRFGGRPGGRRKICMFCMDAVDEVDYKDMQRLRRHISERGKIEPRRKTGACARHQRALTIAIKRARHVALLPFASSSGRP